MITHINRILVLVTHDPNHEWVTPNIDKLAYGGKVLSTWYSGCPVCSGSRAALMTGRQFNRMGVPGVFFPTVSQGLPLNETTVAGQLKKAGYATAAMGKVCADLLLL